MNGKTTKRNIRNSVEGMTLQELADSFNKANKIKKLATETEKFYMHAQKVLFEYVDKDTPS